MVEEAVTGGDLISATVAHVLSRSHRRIGKRQFVEIWLYLTAR